jgi:uncharacterized membrane protein
MTETRRRTLVKSVSYRIVGGLITVAVAYAATGTLRAAAAIGLIDTVVKVGAFYLHERLWLRIDYGRTKAPEYYI